MIKTGETITIGGHSLLPRRIWQISGLFHIFDLHYEEQILTVRCTGARHNLIRLLNYLQNQDISFGQVSSELPTLNDVFLKSPENSPGLRRMTMLHLIKYNLLVKLKNFATTFWPLIFPSLELCFILLLEILMMLISETVQVGIVKEDNADSLFLMFLDQIEKMGNHLIAAQELSEPGCTYQTGK